MSKQKALSRLARVPATLLVVMLMMVGTGCGLGSVTPTPTQVPTATVEAPTTNPTDTAEAPAPTDTAEPAASPTAEAPVPGVNLADLEWKQVGLAGTALQDMALPPGRASVVVAAGPTGAWSSKYDYTNWEQLNVRLEGRSVSVSMGSPDVLYITSHTGCASGGPVTMQRTSDGGKTWQQADKGITPLTVAAANDTLAYGTVCSGIVKTTNAGATWSELPASHIQDYDPGAVATSPDGQQVFAAYYSEGGTARINRSTDAGATWTEVTPKADEFRGPILLAVVPGTEGRPEQAGTYMVSAPGQLWFLPEDTTDWKLTKKDNAMLDNPVADYQITALYVDSNYGEGSGEPVPTIYTARALPGDGKTTGIGVFRSVNGGLTWETVGKGLDQHTISKLGLASTDPSATLKETTILLAAIEDGVWALRWP